MYSPCREIDGGVGIWVFGDLNELSAFNRDSAINIDHFGKGLVSEYACTSPWFGSWKTHITSID